MKRQFNQNRKVVLLSTEIQLNKDAFRFQANFQKGLKGQFIAQV
jgi:hypothetical protein